MTTAIAVIPGFGDRLREERLRLGLTQAQFASNVGVNRISQIFYEKGKNWPHREYIESISSLGVDLVYLLHGQHLETLTRKILDLELLTELFRTIDDMETECGAKFPPQVRAKIFASIYGTNLAPTRAVGADQTLKMEKTS